MSLLTLMIECSVCQGVLVMLRSTINDNYFRASLEQFSQALENYNQELQSYETLLLTVRIGVRTSVNIDDMQEVTTLTRMCKLRLDILLETYLDVLSYQLPPLLNERLRQQFLEFSDIRDMVLRILKVLPPWVILTREVALRPTFLSGQFGINA